MLGRLVAEQSHACLVCSKVLAIVLGCFGSLSYLVGGCLHSLWLVWIGCFAGVVSLSHLFGWVFCGWRLIATGRRFIFAIVLRGVRLPFEAHQVLVHRVAGAVCLPQLVDVV